MDNASFELLVELLRAALALAVREDTDEDVSGAVLRLIEAASRRRAASTTFALGGFLAGAASSGASV